MSADLTDPACQSLLAARRSAELTPSSTSPGGFQPSHDLAYLDDARRRRHRDGSWTPSPRSGVPHLVHMSSVGAYSPKRDDEPVDESYPTERRPVVAVQPAQGAGREASRRVRGRAPRRHPHPDAARHHRPAQRRQRAPALRAAGAAPGPAVRSWSRSCPSTVPCASRWCTPTTSRPRSTWPSPPARVVRSTCRPGRRSPSTTSRSARRPSRPGAQRVVRAAVAGSWHAHLQPIDPGWIDLAYNVPLLARAGPPASSDGTRCTTAPSVLAEVIDAMTIHRARRHPAVHVHAAHSRQSRTAPRETSRSPADVDLRRSAGAHCPPRRGSACHPRGWVERGLDRAPDLHQSAG